LEQKFEDLLKKFFPTASPNLIIAYFFLILALFMVSAAATVLKLIVDVPPILKASWRLQILCIIIFPGFMYSWFSTVDEEMKKKVERR